MSSEFLTRFKYLQILENYIQIRRLFHFSCRTGYHSVREIIVT